MFTLSPGPSQISPETKEDIRRAIEEGVLEISHRSSRFTEISRRCIEELRAYLGVPSEYRVFYFDSATQVWHSLAANLVERNSFHFINGSFSQKAKEASALLGKNAASTEVPWGEQCDFTATEIPRAAELVTVCYNETSTGVKMTQEELVALRRHVSEAFLAVDITSCAGGVPLSMPEADVWYFSVQKCFGLPAGLGVAIISPRAYERSIALQRAGKNLAGIWSWEKLDEMMSGEKYQTPQTPNVLNIHLLGLQCERWNRAGGLSKHIVTTAQKKALVETWMRDRDGCAFFVQDDAHRSDTVFTIGAAPEAIDNAKKALRERGIELGAGYGRIKRDTFRIANFPAITEEMLSEALEVLSEHFHR
jgi:phosphoserine aminotransferase